MSDVEYTNVIPQEPGYYWITTEGFGMWQMAIILLDTIRFDDNEPLIIIMNGTLRPLDDFCNSAEDTILWIGPIEKPEDLEIE